MNDARGEVGADILKITIVLVLGVTFVANALPPALTTWVNSTPTGLGAGAEAMWTLGPLAIVAGIVIYFVATMFGMEKVEDFLN